MTEPLTYTQRGDYLLPDLKLSEPPREIAEPLGRYARMRKAFLQDHRAITYSRLLLSEKLFPHLREVEEAAEARLEQVMSLLEAHSALPGKETDPMGWTAAMNALRAQAEEMVLHELIYS
ncbi:MAG: TnpV protein [Gracilibacteraceae bacterium]|jgi:hypothetical protein|nr:TnpV protein [Gracilibacteraceae bacterium]